MKEKVILKTTDGQSIHCTHYKKGHGQVILIVHGFYGHQESQDVLKLAETFQDRYDVFTFDFRGHGKSSGVYTWAAREKKDLSAVLHYLEQHYAVCGMIAFSLGAFVSFGVLSAKNTIVKSLVAVSPVSVFSKIDFHFWKLDWKKDLGRVLNDTLRDKKRVRVGPFWLAKINPDRVVGALTVPVLYIHGTRDWVVRAWHSKNLYEKTVSKKKLVLITDGPHAEYLIQSHPKEMEDLIQAWFQETLPVKEINISNSTFKLR